MGGGVDGRWGTGPSEGGGTALMPLPDVTDGGSWGGIGVTSEPADGMAPGPDREGGASAPVPGSGVAENELPLPDAPAGQDGVPVPLFVPALVPGPLPVSSPEALRRGPFDPNPSGSGPSWSKTSTNSSSGVGSGRSSAAEARALRAPVAVRKRAFGSGCRSVATTCQRGSGMPFGGPGVPLSAKYSMSALASGLAP